MCFHTMNLYFSANCVKQNLLTVTHHIKTEKYKWLVNQKHITKTSASQFLVTMFSKKSLYFKDLCKVMLWDTVKSILRETV